MFIIKMIKYIVVIYIVINVAVYFGSDYLLFVPPNSSYTNLRDLVKLKTADGATISAVYMPNSGAKYVILYSHGNNEDLGQIMPTLRTFYNWGFAVMAYDYRGYGTSEGKPSEQATYADIAAAYNYLVEKQNISPQRIILFGRSLGAGPSIELATEKPVGGVIVESAFISAYRVITKYPIFLFDKYTSLSSINKIKVPMLFIHGNSDTIVHAWHGRKLYARFNGTKDHSWIDGVGHNDISITNSKIKHAILNFVQKLNHSAANKDI